MKAREFLDASCCVLVERLLRYPSWTRPWLKPADASTQIRWATRGTELTHSPPRPTLSNPLASAENVGWSNLQDKREFVSSQEEHERTRIVCGGRERRLAACTQHWSWPWSRSWSSKDRFLHRFLAPALFRPTIDWQTIMESNARHRR